MAHTMCFRPKTVLLEVATISEFIWDRVLTVNRLTGPLARTGPKTLRPLTVKINMDVAGRGVAVRYCLKPNLHLYNLFWICCTTSSTTNPPQIEASTANPQQVHKKSN